jgi:putative endonuclease
VPEFDPSLSKKKMYYIYLLKDIRRNKFYCGYTNNLERRFSEHNTQKDKEIIYYEAYRVESDARSRERQLKRYAQAMTSLKRRLTESLR